MPVIFMIAFGLLALLPHAVAHEREGREAEGVEYRESAVLNGGTVRGRIRLVGISPRWLRPFEADADEDTCGRLIPNESLIVGRGRGIENVVVLIQGMTRGKPIQHAGAVLDNAGCRFVPRVQVIPAGTKLEITNGDPVLHTAIIYSGEETIFNAALPRRGQRTHALLHHLGLIHVHCGVHPWMAALIWVVNHPYFAVTDEHGNFVITDVPPGEYTVEAWHEVLGSQTAKLRVTEDSTAAANFRFLARPDMPPAIEHHH